MKFWNPWKAVANTDKSTDQNPDKSADTSTATTEEKATCPFSSSKPSETHSESNNPSTEVAADLKKTE